MRIIVVVFEQGAKLLLILNRIFISINRGASMVFVYFNWKRSKGIIIRDRNVCIIFYNELGGVNINE